MSCDWKVNHRFGVALVIHRLKRFVHLWAQGLQKADDHPTNTHYQLRSSRNNTFGIVRVGACVSVRLSVGALLFEPFNL